MNWSMVFEKSEVTSYNISNTFAFMLSSKSIFINHFMPINAWSKHLYCVVFLGYTSKKRI